MFDTGTDGFSEFFQALWDRPPFAWQRDLAGRVLTLTPGPSPEGRGEQGTWPEAIALPTAAGKTACLDIALFALAAEADRLAPGRPLTAPRRIFFVVDRRVIVDEAYERARILAERLERARDGVLLEVANRLRKLAGGDLPLACHQLRGGMYRSDAWARSPTQPAIIAFTVDQLGSRLLFRAYGRSPKAWPIQAGLAGNDSLILLDEAHCAQPFLETLQGIRRFRRWAENPLPTPFHLVVMSATPPAELNDVFHDRSAEPRTPGHPLGNRQLAAKPTRLVEADKAKGAKAGEELAKVLAAQAEALSGNATAAGQKAPATVIFCNRVDTARRVHALLSARHGDRVLLLTGRMRPIDKDDTVGERLVLLAAEQAAQRRLDAPLFVVATQTLEVGANLDFDRLVTEAASLDALRQRFGRLNRMGRPIDAQAVLVIRGDQAEKSDDDPVYGQALATTWTRLDEWKDDEGQVDFGIAALSRHLDRLSSEELADLNAPAAHAPVLLPAHLDALAQTNPEPWPTPEVSLFLHGPKSGPADVQVCWRADLAEKGADDDWLDAVALCPPASPETVAVPIGQFRRWLAGTTTEAGADVEGTTPDQEDAPPSRESRREVRRVIRWRGKEDAAVIENAREVRPGDVVVIPTHQGGWEALATLGAAQPVLDWGDRAGLVTRGKATLRLHPEVLGQWPEAAPLLPFAKRTQDEWDEDPDEFIDGLREALGTIAGTADLPKSLDWLPTAAAHFAQEPLERLLTRHPVQGWVLLGRKPVDPTRDALSVANEIDSFSDEDDPSASGTTHCLLDEHRAGVARLARRFADLCALPPEIAAILETGGEHHDLGKADPRFQAWLKGGNPWAGGPLLAKSTKMAQARRDSETARERAHYPKGGRHELVSVRLLESRPDRLPPEQELRDLLLHLVASHHGHCRPFAPVVEDGVSRPVEHDGFRIDTTATGLERIDSGVAERFWRLTRQYGWWGLAWLEALVRLADHRRSEFEEQAGRNKR